MRSGTAALASLLLVLGIGCCSHYLDDFGAVPHSDTLEAQMVNADALFKAISAANSSSDKTVVVPKKTYYFLPVLVDHVHNLHLLVLGRITASKSVRYWPR